MKHNLPIAVFVGTRADIAPLSPVVKGLLEHFPNEVFLFCGVALDKEAAIAALASEGVDIRSDQVHQLGSIVTSTDELSLARHTGKLCELAANKLTELAIKTVVVLGDRWELLGIIPAAYILQIRIVHLHGGEITEGAIDDRIRHAVSKIADLHCVATGEAKDRLIQLGEPDSRIRVTGAPGLDRYKTAMPLSTEAQQESLGVKPEAPQAIFTYHPPTACEGLPILESAREALQATVDSCGHVLVTHPGADSGREDVLQAIKEVSTQSKNVTVISALGGAFPAWLNTVDIMVGNSSAGVIEAGIVGLPVVNIGNRQKGREAGENVIHCSEGYDAVKQAIGQALAAGRTKNATSPYGTGCSAAEIVDLTANGELLPRNKEFIDQIRSTS